MRRFRSIIILPLLCWFSVAVSQTLSIDSFRLLENDNTASQNRQFDPNGDVAALIKIKTPETGFSFNVGGMGIIGTTQKTEEIWVYVPSGIPYIIIKHTETGASARYNFTNPIENSRTYELVLNTEKLYPSQLITFKVRPQNANIYIDGVLRQLNNSGVLYINLDKGDHSYRVTASNYATANGTITVNNSPITKEITLTTSKAYLSITTISDAEIWLDNRKIGTGSWSGNLDAGTYQVEARKTSYQSAVQKVTLTQGQSKTINLVPEPLGGSLNVTGTPSSSFIYIDGKLMGTTPNTIKDLSVGNHKVEIKKAGYDDSRYNVYITKNEVYYLTYSLKESKSNSNSVSSTSNTVHNSSTSSAYPSYNKYLYANDNKNDYDTETAISTSFGYEFGHMKGPVFGFGLYFNSFVIDTWFSLMHNIPSTPLDWNHMFGFNVGYCINSGSKIQIVPQAGLSWINMDCGDLPDGVSYEDEPDCSSMLFNIGCRTQFTIGRFVGLFIVPEYRFCCDENEIMKGTGVSKSDVGGFSVRAGLELYIHY